MRVAAATALGAAAVKAKILAEAEERELQRQVQVAVDAQIQKVQLKLNSMSQLEDALEKERSIMEVFVLHAGHAHLLRCNFMRNALLLWHRRLVTCALGLPGCCA